MSQASLGDMFHLAFPDFVPGNQNKTPACGSTQEGEMKRTLPESHPLVRFYNAPSSDTRKISYQVRRQQAEALLRALFLPEEHVFCALKSNLPATLGWTVKTREDWLRHFCVCTALPAVFLPNPVIPLPMPCKDSSKLSLRAANSIAEFRHVVFEISELAAKKWFPTWSQRNLANLSAVVRTGVGTLQLFLRIDASTKDEWRAAATPRWLSKAKPRRLESAASLARLAGGLRATLSREEWEYQDRIPQMEPQELLFVAPELRAERQDED